MQFYNNPDPKNVVLSQKVQTVRLLHSLQFSIVPPD